MPIISEKQDGDWIIRSKYKGNVLTYQVSSQGRRVLCDSGIEPGDSIGRRGFHALRKRELIYTKRATRRERGRTTQQRSHRRPVKQVDLSRAGPEPVAEQAEQPDAADRLLDALSSRIEASPAESVQRQSARATSRAIPTAVHVPRDETASSTPPRTGTASVEEIARAVALQVQTANHAEKPAEPPARASGEDGSDWLTVASVGALIGLAVAVLLFAVLASQTDVSEDKAGDVLTAFIICGGLIGLLLSLAMKFNPERTR